MRVAEPTNVFRKRDTDGSFTEVIICRLFKEMMK